MDDRLATTNMGRKEESRYAPFGGGERELGPHLTQCGLGRGLPMYQVASWFIQLFGHNGHSRNVGLPPHQVSSWSIQPFGHNTRTLHTGQTDRQDNGPMAQTIQMSVTTNICNSFTNGPLKIHWWGAGAVMCLKESANDLHMVQLMPVPPYHMLLNKNPDCFNLSGADSPSLRLLNGYLCLSMSSHNNW